jgi:predicted NAD/FAD-binding protein
VRYFVIPAASAIWSSPHSAIYDFPAQAFFRFYKNHGLLGVGNYLPWRTVTGGSQAYVEKMTATFRDKIHLQCQVRAVRRCASGVTLRLADDSERHFDQVVIATHSDQALRLLADPSPDERAILGGLPYQPNTAVLHTDASVMPRRRAAWSAWNYTLYARSGLDQPAALTYWMNALQSLGSDENYFVTVNPAASIDPARIIRTIPYAHPLYTLASFAARQRLPEINGRRQTYFCGAYFTYGFHEDGLQSGVRVAEALGVHWNQPHPALHSEPVKPLLERVMPERLSPAQ